MNCYYCQQPCSVQMTRYKLFLYCNNHKYYVNHYDSNELYLTIFFLEKNDCEYLFYMYPVDNLLILYKNKKTIYKGVPPTNFSPETADELVERLSSLMVFI